MCVVRANTSAAFVSEYSHKYAYERVLEKVLQMPALAPVFDRARNNSLLRSRPRLESGPATGCPESNPHW